MENKNEIYIPAAAGGVGLATTLLKSTGARNVHGGPYDVARLKAYAKKGDIVISGPYEHIFPLERVFQIAHDVNDPKYHASIFWGDKVLELDPNTAEMDLNKLVKRYALTVVRPKLNTKEHAQYLKDIENIGKEYYSNRAAIKAVILDKLHLGNKLKCKEGFCSNVISKQLPKKFFNVQSENVLPKHFLNNPNFDKIVEINKAKNIHLPLSGSSLAKYVLAPVAAAFIATKLYNHYKKK